MGAHNSNVGKTTFCGMVFVMVNKKNKEGNKPLAYFLLYVI